MPIFLASSACLRTLLILCAPVWFKCALLYIVNMLSIYAQTTVLAIDNSPAPDKERAQLFWVAHMNGLKAQAEEVVVREVVYAE